MVDASFTIEYRSIPGYPGYCVGNDGTVWSCWELFYAQGGPALKLA